MIFKVPSSDKQFYGSIIEPLQPSNKYKPVHRIPSYREATPAGGWAQVTAVVMGGEEGTQTFTSGLLASPQ